VQTAPGVPIPLSHDAAPHCVSLAARMVHVVGFVPSHIFCEQTLFLSDIGHVRGRMAVPLIVTHIPGAFGVLHA
jgi:hypothetical protein